MQASEFDTRLRPDELDPEHPRPIETPWGTMALFRLDHAVFCVQAFCPHLEGPLFQGTLSGTTVTCPWHFWRFELATGARVGPFGMPLPGPTLARCATAISPRGTVLLYAPMSD